ncbi:MAG: BCCT family transporter, partial [Cyanobacteriota bacterium]
MAKNGKNQDFEKELLEEGSGYAHGSTNFQKWGLDLHPVVAPVSAIIVLAFVVPTIIFPEQAETVFEEVQDAIANYGGWFYVLVANIFLGVILIFAFSKFGRIRLGGQDAQPEFSTFAWFAMLLI